MALAFVTDRPFVTSNIIGATTLEQLEENIARSMLIFKRGLIEVAKVFSSVYLA